MASMRMALSPAQAALCSGVLWEAATVPGWHRGLRAIALLVTRTSRARSHRTPDAAAYVI